jgi:hypothetical protein
MPPLGQWLSRLDDPIEHHLVSSRLPRPADISEDGERNSESVITTASGIRTGLPTVSLSTQAAKSTRALGSEPS